ncbi:MAG: HAMP domain-containing protein [Armatimonadota bacterium]|nr:HAMP domain-containing protein [Armatimonadota bacterium]
MRLRILAAVAVGLTAVMVVLGFSGVQMLQESKQRLLEERLITARALAERLDDALLRTVQHLAGMAASLDLHRLSDPGAAARWDGLAAQEPLASYSLYLLDARGTVVQAGRRRQSDRGVSLADVEAVRKVLAGSRMAISDLVAAPRTAVPIVLVCVAADPGALCAAADLSRLPLDRYIGGVQLGRTGHAVIVDARGMILASTDADDRFGADEHPDFHAALIARREARVGPAAYYRNHVPIEQHIMAFAPSRVAPWGVSFGETEAETLAPVARMRTRMVGFGIVALLVALAFAWWDTGMVIRPLRCLATQTRRIAAGDLEGTVPVERRDEIGELAESFDAMRERLRALLDDLTRREAEAHALYEVSREVLARPDLGGVLQAVADHARRLLGAEVAVVCLAGERWRGTAAAVSGAADAVIPGAAPLCAGPNRLRLPRTAGGGCPVLRPAYQRSHAVAPLVLDGVVQGALCVGSRGQVGLDARAGSLLAGLANLAAIAMRSADLHEQLHHLAVLEERERIGRDLHDSTLQSLYGIALALEAARSAVLADPAAASERMGQCLAAMAKVTDEIRAFVRGLHRRKETDRPLIEALEALVGEVSATAPFIVRIQAQDRTVDLPEGDRAQVLMIVREALANAVRHSRASQAEVRLEGDGAHLRLEVRDDGCGFDPDAPRAGGEGLGNMQARAAWIGGRLAVRSAPGRGTTVAVEVPRSGGGSGGRGDRPSATAHRG